MLALLGFARPIPSESVLSGDERTSPGARELIYTWFVPSIGDLGEDLDHRRLVASNALQIAVAFELLQNTQKPDSVVVGKASDEPCRHLHQARFRSIEGLRTARMHFKCR
jgi:hypothetical protein